MAESIDSIVLNTWDEKINHFSYYYWLKEVDSLSIRIRCRAFVFQNNINRLLHKFFEVSYTTTILWYTDYSPFHDRENGLLITTEGFHYSDAQQKFNIRWMDIKSIEFVQNPEAKIVINTFDNGWTFPAYCFILNNKVSSVNNIVDILKSILSNIENSRDVAKEEARQTEIEAKQTAEFEAVRVNIEALIGKYQKADQTTRNQTEYRDLLVQALELCDNNVTRFTTPSVLTYFNKTRCTLCRILSSKFDSETAKQYADKAWFYLDEWNKSLGGNMSDYPIQKAIALANCAYPIQNTIQGRNIVLEYLANNNQHIDFGTKIFQNINGRVVDYLNSNSFSNNDLIPFHERQFIMFARSSEKIPGYYDPEDNMKWIFPLDNYPKDLVFQGYPEADVLYMVNPVKQNEYIPFEQAEDFLFMDKVREFCRFVQCLGATEISFRSLKGKKVSNSSSSSNDAKLNMKVIAKGEVNANWSNNDNSSYSSNQSVEMRQTFTPNRAPFCPDDLVWLKTDANMRELLKQRLEYGTINSYSYKISSSETCQLTNRKALDIKASFEKIMVKVNANYSQSSDTTFNNHEETEWEINVIFKPISELPQLSNVAESPRVNVESQMNVSDLESKYVEFIKLILEDGIIGENERKTLERRRLKLGISVERAKELEEMLMNPLLNDNEKEYFDEVIAMLDDGIIDAKERKVLNMMLEDLEIDPNRAEDIEQMAINKQKQ